MNIIFPDNVKKCAKMQTNGDVSLYADFPELYHIDKHLVSLQPKNVLEIGCGIGRASVFLFKKYEWNDARFYLADGNTCDKRYKGKREQRGEYYNEQSATKSFCEANGLKKF
jgi:ubiquinone/menaquinone biosynthesis C-methylase UbiE